MSYSSSLLVPYYLLLPREREREGEKEGRAPLPLLFFTGDNLTASPLKAVARYEASEGHSLASSSALPPSFRPSGTGAKADLPSRPPPWAQTTLATPTPPPAPCGRYGCDQDACPPVLIGCATRGSCSVCFSR